jgi:hypothetical protein
MKLWINSDLHIELTRYWDLPTGDARPNFDVLRRWRPDHRMERCESWLLARVPDPPVVYVAGNHEFYGTDLDRTVEKARIAEAGTSIHIQQNDSVTIGGTIFLGATGWTNFNLFGDANCQRGDEQLPENPSRELRASVTSDAYACASQGDPRVPAARIEPTKNPAARRRYSHGGSCGSRYAVDSSTI